MFRLRLRSFVARISMALAVALASLAAPEARAWTSPVNLTNMASGSRAFGPAVACDSFNTLRLLWTGGVDPAENWQVWYQSCGGSSWNLAKALCTPGGTRPDIAVDGNNNLHVCYEDDAEHGIWYRRWTYSGWSTPVSITTGGRSISSHLAVDDSGNRIMIAWHEDGEVGGAWDILAKVYSGGAWGPTFNVSSDTASSSEARVAIDSAGGFHVIWQSAGQEVYYRRRNADGGWGDKTRLDHTSNRSGVGSIAIAPNGFVHVVFSEGDGPGWEVFHTYFNGTSWSAPVNVSNHGGASDDISPALAIDAYGRLYTAWHDYNNIFFSSRQDLGSPWSARETIVGGKYLATDPTIAVDGSGVAHVLWQSRPAEASRWDIYYSTQGNVSPR